MRVTLWSCEPCSGAPGGVLPPAAMAAMSSRDPLPDPTVRTGTHEHIHDYSHVIYVNTFKGYLYLRMRVKLVCSLSIIVVMTIKWKEKI